MRNMTFGFQGIPVQKISTIPMAKPSSNRRLFQADGYTFIRWITDIDVVRMLEAKEIQPCFDLRSNREIGFQLIERKSERIADTAAVLPFSRPTRPKDKFHYEIPYAGDCRSVCIRRFRLRRKDLIGAGTKSVLLSRTIRVSARKIDFTAAAYLTPTRVLRNSTPSSSSLIQQQA